MAISILNKPWRRAENPCERRDSLVDAALSVTGEPWFRRRVQNHYRVRNFDISEIWSSVRCERSELQGKPSHRCTGHWPGGFSAKRQPFIEVSPYVPGTVSPFTLL